MGTLARTWKLYKASFEVLNADIEMLLFPVMSGAAALTVSTSFVLPMHQTGLLRQLATGKADWEVYAILFAYYFALYAVILFFNSALTVCAYIRLSGGDPTVRDGLRIAFSRMHRILAWALVAATAGVLLQWLRGRRSRGASVAGALAGVSWTLITFLILPVLLFEGRGIFDSIQRSAALFRKHWGEQLAGSFGFGLLNFLLALPALGLGALIWPLDQPAALIVAVVYLLILAVLLSAARGVFTVALYRYATAGQGSRGFTAELIEDTLSKGGKVQWP